MTDINKQELVTKGNNAGQVAATKAIIDSVLFLHKENSHIYLAAFYTAITGVLSVELDKNYFTELVTNISKLANNGNEDKSFERLEFLIDHQAIIGSFEDVEGVTHYRVESAGRILNKEWHVSSSAAIDAAILESAE